MNRTNTPTQEVKKSYRASPKEKERRTMWVLWEKANNKKIIEY